MRDVRDPRSRPAGAWPPCARRRCRRRRRLLARRLLTRPPAHPPACSPAARPPACLPAAAPYVPDQQLAALFDWRGAGFRSFHGWMVSVATGVNAVLAAFYLRFIVSPPAPPLLLCSWGLGRAAACSGRPARAAHALCCCRCRHERLLVNNAADSTLCPCPERVPLPATPPLSSRRLALTPAHHCVCVCYICGLWPSTVKPPSLRRASSQVQRAKKCLDFSGTILLLHLVVVTCISGFPRSAAWCAAPWLPPRLPPARALAVSGCSTAPRLAACLQHRC